MSGSKTKKKWDRKLASLLERRRRRLLVQQSCKVDKIIAILMFIVVMIFIYLKVIGG